MYFERSCNINVWYVFTAIWYIWWSFGLFFSVLVCRTKKLMAIL
jgi:hypothetical protein